MKIHIIDMSLCKKTKTLKEKPTSVKRLKTPTCRI